MKRIKEFFRSKMIVRRKQRPSTIVVGDATWVCGGEDC